jgi:membrane protein DedA with SNARE-associated domain
MSTEHAGQGIGGSERRGWIVALVIVALILIGRLTPFRPVQGFFDNFSWLTRQALKIAESLFESYGYLTVFLAPLLENTIFLGALVPGLLIMMLAGLSAHDGLIDLWKAIPLAIAGAWIGDTISYGIGRFGWQRLGPESRLVKMSERMREPLLKHSTWVVLLYHFAGYSRTIGPAASGFLRIPFRRWLLLDYAGSALWVVVFMSIGYLLGVASLSLDASDRNVRVIEAILFALGAIALITVMMRSRRRQSASGEDDMRTAG